MKTDLSKVAKDLEAKYPKYTAHIQDRVQDFDWQLMCWEDTRGNCVVSTPAGGLYYEDTLKAFHGGFLQLTPIYMDEEQFKYNLLMELEELEAPFVEQQKIFDEDVLCRQLANDVCGIYGN